MTRIMVSPPCGNSPKMEFIKQFNVAFAAGNITFLIENVTDNITWHIIGDKKIEGKKAFKKELEKMQSVKVVELRIDQILSHGKDGAAHGTMTMENGKDFAFSDFYLFQSAKGKKIETITSYCLEV